MFLKKTTEGYIPAIEKIKMKTLSYGEKTLMSEFRMRKGALLPEHSHPHEQTGYLISGKIKLTIGEQTYSVGPGDSWTIHGGMKHQAEIEEDSVAIEVFSPVREDYLPE